MRILHLAFERPPHPYAVHHAATESDVRLVLDLLARPQIERADLAETLRNRLRVQLSRPRSRRTMIPIRTSDALYRLVPWRLAKWLSHVLPAPESTIERTRQRLDHWLAHDQSPHVIRPFA